MLKRSITKRLIAYFVMVLLLFAFLTSGIYIWVFRRTIVAYAKESFLSRGQRIAQFLTHWQRDGIAIEPSRGSGEESAAEGTAKGRQERRGVRGYRMGQSAALSLLSQVEAGELWLIDKKTETVFSADGGKIATENMPESIDALLGEVLAGQSVYSEDFGAFFGTPSMTAGYPIYGTGSEVVLAFFLHSSIEEATRGLMGVWQGMLYSLLAALVVVVLLSVILSRHFVKPLNELKFVTARLADGDYAARSALAVRDEIGQLSKEIDILAAKLQEAEGERRQSDQLRRKFLSEISHELRTPVTVIRGSLEALRDGVVSEQDLPVYYQTMSHSAGSLERLVNDLLELTRLDNPEFTLDMDDVSLLAVTEDAVRQMRQIASARGVAIDLTARGSDCVLRGDYGRLRQMLTNILSNAVKFSPDGSHVRVDYYSEAEGDTVRAFPTGKNGTRNRLKVLRKSPDETRCRALIRIQDNGIGMSEETKRHLFERFYTTGSAKADSTGLGLSIAKSIADRHQIDIEVESLERKGTTVTLLFR